MYAYPYVQALKTRALEWMEEPEEVETDDWETLPDYPLVQPAGGQCAHAVLHSLPRGPAGKLSTLVLLAAALTAVKRSLRVPMAVLVRGLLSARLMLGPAGSHGRSLGAESADPLDWASLFEGLHPEHADGPHDVGRDGVQDATHEGGTPAHSTASNAPRWTASSARP